MDAKARQALHSIQECLSSDRFVLLPHFVQRMAQRGLFWPDVLSIVDKPTHVIQAGIDRFGRPKWIVGGKAADALHFELICAFDEDPQGKLTVLITAYTVV